MGVHIELDMRAIKNLEKAVPESAKKAMEQLIIDVRGEQTMPFDTGDMQNNQTFVTAEDGCVRLVTGSPQSRRLYYHPEYNFQRGKNANAGGKWLEAYISGDKKDFVKEQFKREFKRRTGV